MMCERPPRSLRSCERIGDKGSDPLAEFHRSNNIPWGLTPRPQFVHSFFARVSPLQGGDYPSSIAALFSPSVKGRAAAGGRGSLTRHFESKRLTDTPEEFAARLAWSWIELQSIIQTQNHVRCPDPQTDTV